MIRLLLAPLQLSAALILWLLFLAFIAGTLLLLILHWLATGVRI